MPDYEILDPIIELYVEKDFSVKEIIQEGFDEKTVEKVIGLIDFNEYKRRQSPLGVKISTEILTRVEDILSPIHGNPIYRVIVRKTSPFCAFEGN